MSAYQVMMTLEVPQLRVPRHWEIKVPRHLGTLRVYGSAGRLAVLGTVREQSPADAAIVVATAVLADWDKSQGPIRVVSWKAHREGVFAGLGRRSRAVTSSSQPWRGGPRYGYGRGYGDPDGPDGPDEAGGSAGVREPRRPLPGPGSMSAELEIPRETTRETQLD